MRSVCVSTAAEERVADVADNHTGSTCWVTDMGGAEHAAASNSRSFSRTPICRPHPAERAELPVVRPGKPKEEVKSPRWRRRIARTSSRATSRDLLESKQAPRCKPHLVGGDPKGIANSEEVRRRGCGPLISTTIRTGTGSTCSGRTPTTSSPSSGSLLSPLVGRSSAPQDLPEARPTRRTSRTTRSLFILAEPR